MSIKKQFPLKKDYKLSGVSVGQSMHKKCCSKFWPVITYVIVVLIIILAGAKIWIINWRNASLIDSKTYQVVFLDNGESYFGKLENIGFNNYRLSNVYYLKSFPKNQESAATAENSETSADSTDNYELKLIKLGDQEFYKPYNSMIINKNKILYWENLQSGSEVMNYISGK